MVPPQPCIQPSDKKQTISKIIFQLIQKGMETKVGGDSV